MYPKRKDLFDAWHKAMVAGATVDKPNYGKTTNRVRKNNKAWNGRAASRRKRLTRRKKNAET